MPTLEQIASAAAARPPLPGAVIGGSIFPIGPLPSLAEQIIAQCVPMPDDPPMGIDPVMGSQAPPVPKHNDPDFQARCRIAALRRCAALVAAAVDLDLGPPPPPGDADPSNIHGRWSDHQDHRAALQRWARAAADVIIRHATDAEITAAYLVITAAPDKEKILAAARAAVKN